MTTKDLKDVTIRLLHGHVVILSTSDLDEVLKFFNEDKPQIWNVIRSKGYMRSEWMDRWEVWIERHDAELIRETFIKKPNDQTTSVQAAP